MGRRTSCTTWTRANETTRSPASRSPSSISPSKASPATAALSPTNGRISPKKSKGDCRWPTATLNTANCTPDAGSHALLIDGTSEYSLEMYQMRYLQTPIISSRLSKRRTPCPFMSRISAGEVAECRLP